MPASPSATAEHIKDVNTRYHDAAAASYDAKWGIDFGEIGQEQVRAKLVKALGRDPAAPYGNALEIGAGTGYFSLNLAQLGLIERLTVTDISPGMLTTLKERAERLGVEVNAVVAEAEQLPFDDQSFDLVLGHAVLHHIPDLPRAFSEFRRLLRPGGEILFCGEPSRHGDRLAVLPKRGGMLLGPLWRRAIGAPAAPATNGTRGAGGHELESEVDVHTFSAAELRRWIGDAEFEHVRVGGEELIANAYGWLLRSLEAHAPPEKVPLRWRQFAYRSYIALQRLDAALLEPRLPAELFYNLLVSARRPA